jgi:hypothetical protein
MLFVLGRDVGSPADASSRAVSPSQTTAVTTEIFSVLPYTTLAVEPVTAAQSKQSPARVTTSVFGKEILPDP